LTESLGLSPITARVLVNRGFDSVDEAKRFLAPSAEDLFDPFLLPISKAVDRLVKAIQATSLFLSTVITMWTAFLPLLYLEVLRELARRCLTTFLIVSKRVTVSTERPSNGSRSRRTPLDTADCGTASKSEIALANSLGLDVIVTDHHQVPAEMPAAYALINPHRPDSRYPFQGLCATGLAFKVTQALLEKIFGDSSTSSGNSDRLAPRLDLVTLATIADLVPLVGENRYLVKLGLAQLSKNHRIGIRALKEDAGLKDEVGVGTVGFSLGPRINAAGRLSSADTGVRLLTTRNPDEARQLSAAIDQANRERQQIEERVLEETIAQIRREGLEKIKHWSLPPGIGISGGRDRGLTNRGAISPSYRVDCHRSGRHR
jgi:single-stranded-DNA-specific exonuclease